MKKNQINHNALIHLVEADAISVAIVKAMGDTWALTVQVGDTLKIVMAKNSGKPRVWRKLDTLAKYLKDMGIDKFHIDVSSYDPSQKSLRRPDSANILKETHKSHQSLQKQSVTTDETVSKTNEPEIKVTTPEVPTVSEVNAPQSVVESEPVKRNPTDAAIELAKQRWEQRRAKILQEENPRAK